MSDATGEAEGMGLRVAGRAFLRPGWISRHRIGPSARAFGCQQTVTGFVSRHEGRES